MQSYLKFFILPIVFLILSCSEQNRALLVDTSSVQLDSIRILRFDKELQQLVNASPEEVTALHRQWKLEYGPFYQDFIEGILQLGWVEDEGLITEQLYKLGQSEVFADISAEIQATFPNLAIEEKELTEAFKRLKYHLPEAYIPEEFVSYYSGFSVQIPIGNNYMGMGLDLFLGDNHPFYQTLAQHFPPHISQHFTPENLVPRVVESYIYEELLHQDVQQATFLEHMFRHGKALYLMDALLPDTEDRLKIGYTEAQLTWANAFQKKIWDWMIEEEFLYQTDPALIARQFADAPFTPELGKNNESSPKLGRFIGWQIVRRYMKEHPETTIEELLEMKDAQGFLLDANYKGR
jgi:hypothetical protein